MLKCMILFVSVFLRVSLVWGVKLYACVGAELIFV